MASRPDLSGMSFTAEPLIGKMVWHDLITEDIDAARRFYGGLFGWTFEESTTRGDDYLLARDGNVYVAGLVPIERPDDGTRLSRWLPYVSVPDVDDAVERSVAAGATVAASPRDVGLGRVAAIVDPQGAVVGLARSAVGDPDDRTTAAAPGRVVWSELLAADPAAAAAFYQTVVGYAPRTIERRRGTYTLLAAAGKDRAGILENPSEEWEPLWLTYFGVDDPRAAAATAAELGGHIVLEPSPEIREGSMAIVTDPSGAVLVLQRWSAQQEAAK
jgi:predicted enzyme related to lactoylglutathione lyase